MIESLEALDRELLLAINGFNSPFFDTFFYALTQTWASIPVFLFGIFLLYRKFGLKQTLLCIVIVASAVGIADLISVNCFKNVVCRYRPSHNLEIENLVHIVNGYKGGMYGFVSSHAANMFAFSITTALLLKKKAWAFFVLTWSLLVSYTRMYLGVHYPADIFVGAMLGATTGYFVWLIGRRFIN